MTICVILCKIYVRMTKKIAVIDLGTNTFHVLVAAISNSEMKVLHNEKLSVKIGRGGINDGIITAQAQQRALDALTYFKATIDTYDVDETFATATSAIRNAKNGRDLVEKIRRQTGINVTIISGDLEARYIYRAVKKAVNIGDVTSLIMDIGGGSVEFIICNDHEIFWKESFEIGAQRLLDLFHYHDPILREEIENLHLFLTDRLLTLIHACLKFKPTVLIGASGSFDTFSDIYRSKANVHKINEQTELPLSVESFHEMYQDIISKNKEDRMAIPGMLEMRVDMIVVASILLDFVIANCSIKTIRVSSYSLKEGVLFNILDGLSMD